MTARSSPEGGSEVDVLDGRWVAKLGRLEPGAAAAGLSWPLSPEMDEATVCPDSSGTGLASAPGGSPARRPTGIR